MWLRVGLIALDGLTERFLDECIIALLLWFWIFWIICEIIL